MRKDSKSAPLCWCRRRHQLLHCGLPDQADAGRMAEACEGFQPRDEHVPFYDFQRYHDRVSSYHRADQSTLGASTQDRSISTVNKLAKSTRHDVMPFATGWITARSRCLNVLRLTASDGHNRPITADAFRVFWASRGRGATRFGDGGRDDGGDHRRIHHEPITAHTGSGRDLDAAGFRRPAAA
ncbi:hypothetical protein CSOJ01_01105 [Colletotrichum sojae]|uniref:Uncharacterized protein n=1 Tax=Colletotrichum sojae TaxID=2175907 RepID=A0A8H6JVX0_9PEZI|nr:hypothetical protein CSOJ01_01105 [Colletotrichum sojae]